MDNAQHFIDLGNKFPFDAPDEWREESDDSPPPPPTDWAHSAARGVISNLKDRRGIKNELDADDIDEETRQELVQSLAAIIRKANENAATK